MVTKAKHLCRLCLYDLSQGNRNSIDLFSNDLKKNTRNAVAEVLRGIKACYQIEILKNDGLTTKVCETCIELLEIFYQTQIYVKGINAVLSSTKNFNTLFSAKSGNETNTEITESGSSEESDEDEEHDSNYKSSKVKSANSIMKKRKTQLPNALEKSKNEMEEFKKKLEPFKKKYKAKTQILNKEMNMKIGKKRGRPPKMFSSFNHCKQVDDANALPCSNETVEEGLASSENKGTLIYEPTSSECGNDKNDEMDTDFEVAGCDIVNEKRASSGRLVKPRVERDFV